MQILNIVVYLACDQLPQHSIATTLQTGWGLSTDVRNCLNTALIVCAEHELNTSTFTGRCIASADANIYQVIIGALAAFSGNKHGGMLERINNEYQQILNNKSPETELLQRLHQGSLVGFNHPLYPSGDPRAKLLLIALAQIKPNQKLYEHLQKILTLLNNEALQPSVDFALVATEQCLQLPPDSALKLFTIGRIVGWVAHALEQYQRDSQIRPRGSHV